MSTPDNGESDRERLSAAIAAVPDPRFFHGISALGMLRSIEVSGSRAVVVVAVPQGGHPDPDALIEVISEGAHRAGASETNVELVSMTEDEQSEFLARLHELGRAAAPGAPVRHGEAGPTPRPNPFSERGSSTRVLLIASGKGGVGKSSVSVNLAVSLACLGYSVGILDADVYGFSVPAMLGITEAPSLVGDLLLPPVAFGVRCISMGFFVPEDQAVIWRGPMLHKALEQFLVDVHWGSPDFLLVDLPPGTGDVSLSISQFVPGAELYVVTTPQPASERVAQRAAVLARQVRLPLRGVVENMSWFSGDDGRRYELFGRGGGEALSSSLGVPLLAQLPFLPALREGGDAGRPIVAAEPEGEAAVAFRELATAVVSLGPARVYRSELSVR